MYTRTYLYKIYAILTLVTSAIGFFSSIVIAVTPLGCFLNEIVKSNTYIVILKLDMLFISGVGLFFSYIEFSSMFQFADMINYEKSNSVHPMKKRGFVFKSGFYRNFGFVIFMISLVINIILIAAIIISSVNKHEFISLPLIPIAIIVLTSLFTYVHYYTRYKAIGDLIDTLTADELLETQKMNLKENKSNILRGYCIFLYVICVLFSIAVIITFFITAKTLSAAIGTGLTIILFAAALILMGITVFFTGIFGCYVDNIAKMIEHYQIRYKLI